MSGRLVVQVGGQRAGVLAADATGRHVYAYDADCPPERFVSLTMPVRLESYAWHELHPVFQVNLADEPRGTTSAARAGAMRPIDGLPLLGERALGRVRAAVAGAAPALSVATGDSGTNSAGPVPARPGADDTPPALIRTDSAELPDLAVNGWCGLRVARRAGFDVPPFALVDDGRRMVVERFDGPPNARLGYEDFCSLTGLGARQKYEGAAEQLVSAAAAFVAPVRRTGVRRELFRRIAFAQLLGNGDAHLKSYGVLYTDTADVRLAPLHDAVTTRVYPVLADETPALAIAGRRAWRAKPGTWRRFGAHCALSDRECASIFQWLAQAVRTELDELAREITAPERAAFLGQLRARWLAGIDDLQAGW